MTDDQIIRLAREAGVPTFMESRQSNRSVMLRFGRLVRNASIDEAVAYVRNQGFGAIASDAMAERLKS